MPTIEELQKPKATVARDPRQEALDQYMQRLTTPVEYEDPVTQSIERFGEAKGIPGKIGAGAVGILQLLNTSMGQRALASQQSDRFGKEAYLATASKLEEQEQARRTATEGRETQRIQDLMAYGKAAAKPVKAKKPDKHVLVDGQTGEFTDIETGNPINPNDPAHKDFNIKTHKVIPPGGADVVRMNQKRAVLKEVLDKFFEIDDRIPRGETVPGRIAEGAWSNVLGFLQMGERGAAVAAHEAIAKKLRVQLVRAAGDVGNINIVEQEAAEKLIPKVGDSQRVKDIKKKFLYDTTRALESDDPDEIKRVLIEHDIGFDPIVEIERATPDGKVAIFNEGTKEFIRYKE